VKGFAKRTGTLKPRENKLHSRGSTGTMEVVQGLILLLVRRVCRLLGGEPLLSKKIRTKLSGGGKRRGTNCQPYGGDPAGHFVAIRMANKRGKVVIEGYTSEG